MKKLLVLTVGISLLGSCALATWSDANGRGLIPYYLTGGDWYTVLTIVNGSEETSDQIYIRFLPVHGDGFGDLSMSYSIRQQEMLIFSTTPAVPMYIPVSAGFGYIQFRVQGGGFVQAFCAIHNPVTGRGYIVPAYHQDAGF